MTENDLNPLSLFDSLCAPTATSSGSAQFAARPLPSRPADFVAKGRDNQPALLIAVPDTSSGMRPPPITLEHLMADHGLECRVQQPDGSIHQGVFSVIQCVDADRLLQEHFLRAIVPVVQGLPLPPVYRDVSSAVNSLAELFRQMSLPGRKSIQGLWAELFLITSANRPNVLVKAWHSTPGDRYDFNSGTERIEVKSASGRARTHHFSFEQLHPPDNTRVHIASIFIEEAGNGQSIFDLVDTIRHQTHNDVRIAERIDQIVGATLGANWRQAADMRFDYELAATSLCFFDSASIPTVPEPLPAGVSDVRFQADLSLGTKANLGEITDKGILFSALSPSCSFEVD